MSVFYLSGGMEYKTNLGAKWRTWLTSELEKLGQGVVDPVALESDRSAQPMSQEDLSAWKENGQFDDVRYAVRKYLFRRDIQGLHTADAMVLFYDESVQKGAGTLSEAWEAFREGKPVYLVTEFPFSKIPTWLIGETTAIFASFELLLEYVKNENRVVLDIQNAEKISSEVLAGIC